MTCALGRAWRWTAPRDPGPVPIFNHTSCGRCVQYWVLAFFSDACLVVRGRTWSPRLDLETHAGLTDASYSYGPTLDLFSNARLVDPRYTCRPTLDLWTYAGLIDPAKSCRPRQVFHARWARAGPGPLGSKILKTEGLIFLSYMADRRCLRRV